MKNILAVLSIAMLSFTAYAGQSDATQAVSTDFDALWMTLDSDKDGFLTKEESASSSTISDNWDAIDANKDAKIDSAEFVQFYSKS